jgi:hypothetical protein
MQQRRAQQIRILDPVQFQPRRVVEIMKQRAQDRLAGLFMRREQLVQIRQNL